MAPAMTGLCGGADPVLPMPSNNEQQRDLAKVVEPNSPSKRLSLLLRKVLRPKTTSGTVLRTGEHQNDIMKSLKVIHENEVEVKSHLVEASKPVLGVFVVGVPVTDPGLSTDEASLTSAPSDYVSSAPSDPPGFDRPRAVKLSPELQCTSHDGPLQVFDDYEFLCALGCGSFGRVLTVRHKTTAELRACKAIQASTPMENELIRTEIAVLNYLNHPNVLRLHEVYMEPSTGEKQKVFLITELCEGGDLLFRINYHMETLKAPMSEGRSGYILRQILSAARYCHSRGIVHRDIKPDNILFVDASACSVVKLVDFGLAGFAEKLRESAKSVTVPRSHSAARLAKILPSAGARWLHVRKLMMQRAGTAYYMAPEMIQVGCYDQKADLFSIGAVFCEMLTGSHPFYTPKVDDAQSVVAKISSSRAVRLPKDKYEKVSFAAQELCHRLLEKDPKQRLSAAEALDHQFFRNPALPSPYGSDSFVAVAETVFNGLRRFQAQNTLRRAAMLCLGQGLGAVRSQEMREAFMALDSEGDGFLSPAELLEGASKANIDLSESEAESMIAAMGASCCSSRLAGYKEFVSALSGCFLEFSDADLTDTFQRLDVKRQGILWRDSFNQLLDPESAISEEEWQEIAGASPGAAVTLHDFLRLMQDRATPSHVQAEAVEVENRASQVCHEISRLWHWCSAPRCYASSAVSL